MHKYNNFTKDEIEKDLIHAKRVLEQMINGDESVLDVDEALGESVEDQIARQQKEVEYYTKELGTADDGHMSDELIPVEFVKDEDGSPQFVGCTEIDGTAATLDVYNDVDSIKNRSGFSFQRDSDHYIDFWNGSTETDPGISKDDALKQALELAEKMGMGEIALNSSKLVSSTKKDDSVYVFYFQRSYNGLHLTNPEQLPIFDDEDFVEPYSIVYTPEEIQIGIDKDGIRAVHWSYPSEWLETVNYNVALKPFDELKERFRDYLFQTTADVGGSFETEINVNKAQLSAAMMRVKDGAEGEFYIIPVWDILGTGTEKDPVDGTIYQMVRGSEVAFVTINAIDGSNFDRFYMY